MRKLNRRVAYALSAKKKQTNKYLELLLLLLLFNDGAKLIHAEDDGK